jgi:hypothetical protein
MSNQPVDIKALIAERLAELIREQTEIVIKEAVKDFESLVREKVGRIALAVLDCYSVERLATEIVIHVKIESPKENP